MERVEFSCPADELSCIIGNLFLTLQPPCYCEDKTALVIQGITHSQTHGELIIKNDYCIFFGELADLDAVLHKNCLERRCKNG